MAQNTVKARMGQNARHLRFVSREEAFKQKRRTYDELDYLQFYSPTIREQILTSMQGPIPDPLPPLSLITISYYRRKSQPIFMTRREESLEFEAHMMYESLWILSSLEEKMFEDYQSVIKQFERDLRLYLWVNSNDIKEMAIIAAGNKIIGKQSQIISILEKDSRQLWVLANHIYESKIPFQRLFPFLNKEHEMAFKTVFQLTMLIESEVSQSIMSEEDVITNILMAMNANNEVIRTYAIRIVGNIVVSKDDFIAVLHKYQILDYLYCNLNCSNGDIRRDICWLISNMCSKKGMATLLLQNTLIISKLVDLFAYETISDIKREITYVFCYLANFADKNKAFILLGHPNVLEICYNQLCIEDFDLNIATLLLLKELIQLGDGFPNQEGRNTIIHMMQQSRALYNEISSKCYSDNVEVTDMSIVIMNSLQEDQ